MNDWPVDEHGTPHRSLYLERTQRRLIAEMLGFCKGVIADGVVNEDEAIALYAWMRANPDVAVSFPGNHIAERLTRIFRDGAVDLDERIELEDLLNDLVGEDPHRVTSLDRPTALLFDDPLPALQFSGWEYVLTGRFAFGPRKACEAVITQLGGTVGKAITRRTHVLVVGTFASPAWVQSSFGNKLLSASARRGTGLKVVPEQHWLQYVA